MARKESDLLSDPMGKPLKKPRGVKPVSGDAAEVKRAKKALLRRSKTSERDFAKWLVNADGPDTRMRGLTTSTGRIGHVTAIQADVLTKTYIAECKNEIVPVKWLRYWQKIVAKGGEWHKVPLMMWEPSNKSRVDPKLPDMHILTPDRHEELLRKEQAYDACCGRKK